MKNITVVSKRTPEAIRAIMEQESMKRNVPFIVADRIVVDPEDGNLYYLKNEIWYDQEHNAV